MIRTMAHEIGNRLTLSILTIWVVITPTAFGQERPDGVAQERPRGIAAAKIELLALTSLWKGDRCSDGRPKVPDDLLKRMNAVSIEEAWDVLRQKGYENQFVGGWQMLHQDRPFVVRAHGRLSPQPPRPR